MRDNHRDQHLSKAVEVQWSEDSQGILSKGKGEFVILISFLTKIDTHGLGEPFKVPK